MTKIAQPQSATPARSQSATQPEAPDTKPTIAIRRSCNPDGIGLSHYVLMDRKAAK